MNNYNIDETIAMEKYLVIAPSTKMVSLDIKKRICQPRTVDDSHTT